MSAQHTPGPWIVTHVPTSAGSAYRIGQPGLEKGCAWIYADGMRNGIDDKLPRAIELGANARLIAAAPDHHAVALELNRLCLVIESAVRHSDPANHAAVVTLILANHAAIAKATGAVS